MVRIQRRDGGRELALFDPVENARARLHFEEPVAPDRIEPADFPVSVDATFRVQTPRIGIGAVPEVTVRHPSGRAVCPDTDDPLSYGHDSYLIEISTSLKLYLSVEAPITVRVDETALTVDFGEPTAVRIGARILREKPRHTVRTTLDVEDLCAAVSSFGSAIRSWGPERSYPSLRGHPPRLEIADSLEIPPSAAAPDTAIQLQIPDERINVAVAAPLAYYLGATVIPGDRPRLLAHDEPILEFEGDRSLGSQFADVTERMLFLDCLARQSWEYDISLVERDEVANSLGDDWEDLASLSLADRLREYLAISPDEYRAYLPNWDRRAAVVPTERGVRSLPYLAYDLIGIHESRRPIRHSAQPSPRISTDGGSVRANGAEPRFTRSEAFVWETIGRQPPIGLNPAYPVAFENRHRRGADRETIGIAVVCNDEKMAAELEYVWSVYDRHDDPFVTVERYEGLSRSELREVLDQRNAYFHYIGHIDSTGFRCTDGPLDADGLSDVGMEICFLNACASKTQALGLIEAGVGGAIATESRVLNKAAVRMGEQLAGLLIHGFPLGTALSLVRPNGGAGHQYTVVGDPTLAIAQAETGVPYFCEIDAIDEDRYELVVESALTSLARVGSACTFRVQEASEYYLSPTRQRFVIDGDTLDRFLALEPVPVVVDDDLRWSDEPLDRLVG